MDYDELEEEPEDEDLTDELEEELEEEDYFEEEDDTIQELDVDRDLRYGTDQDEEAE